MLETIFSIAFFLFDGNIIDTKLKHHKYEKEDYKKIFKLKNKESVNAYCVKHSEIENVKKVKHYQAGGGQEIRYKITKSIEKEVKTQYWDNGKVLSQIHYLNGMRDGSCRHWYKNGQLMNEGFYKNGKMTGIWMSYYENGQLESQGTYKYTESGVYSRKYGVWKYYYDNGQLQSESIIKDGVEELKFYDEEGNLLPKEEGC